MLGSLSQICHDPVVPSGEQLHSNVFWPFLCFYSLTETKLPFQVYLNTQKSEFNELNFSLHHMLKGNQKYVVAMLGPIYFSMRSMH